MDLYEYQGKQFFATYGIPVSPGEAVTSVDDAVAAASPTSTGDAKSAGIALKAHTSEADP